MPNNEAQARIKINRLLENAGWRFFDDENGRANIQLEQGVTITQNDIDAFGEDFENSRLGVIDFLLLNDSGFPLCVLEAKKESKLPLDGKEQARQYAQSINVRYIILSNGNSHYFWDREKGNPYIITQFPTQESLLDHISFTPKPEMLVNELVEDDYVAKTQKPNYANDPRYLDESQRSDFLKENGLMLLRDYQLKAVQSIQRSMNEGNSRFLFEMATGTGKTLIAAAVIKLFLRTSNAKRVLFLVDRIELEDQAEKAFTRYLKNDYQTAVFKRSRNNWNNAEIVVSTVQSLNDKYPQLFSPTDFDLVISDEAHRSIGGNSRAVFEYFSGYKLGLTATPKDYLKNIENIDERDPREVERRLLLDTYETFGCATGEPTFRYSLIEGVEDGFLISPIVADARTEITTQLLSDEGYAVQIENEEGELVDKIFKHRDFERKFYSEETNQVFCETFIKNALRDPISGEIGKSIIFCVSQFHASKVTQILNQIAMEVFPGKYNSDFAVQVTSSITGAQQFTINFANNKLNGKTKWLDTYKSSKTRVCVTVGMMTTGYDCQDILNLCMMRPIFSPTDFVQIKGRGTRTFTFNYKQRNSFGEMEVTGEDKKAFKILDFFANFEYFEEKFNYDEELKVPIKRDPPGPPGPPQPPIIDYENIDLDPLKKIKTKDPQGEFWKIDFKYWGYFTEKLKDHEIVESFVREGNMKAAEDYVRKYVFDKPEEFFTLDKLQKSVQVDRRLSLRELLERAFDLIPHFKSKAEKLDEECDKFISIYKPDPEQVMYVRNFLRAYIIDKNVRQIVKSREYGKLNVNPIYSDFKALNNEWRERIPLYVQDYVSLSEYQ
jgi:type I restriction enzyme R subunit